MGCADKVSLVGKNVELKAYVNFAITKRKRLKLRAIMFKLKFR